MPRTITAEEIVAERKALLSSGQHWPHDYNARCGVWVSCDCPKCRDYYDPTGEESAKFLNFEYPSWFNGQSDHPSFMAFSELAKESYYAALTEGWYIGNAKKPAQLEDVAMILTPPLALKPKRILHLANGMWDEYLLSEDKTSWTRRTYEKGRTKYYEAGTNPPIPFDLFPKYLIDTFGAAV